jgi:hypothetical protein
MPFGVPRLESAHRTVAASILPIHPLWAMNLRFLSGEICPEKTGQKANESAMRLFVRDHAALPCAPLLRRSRNILQTWIAWEGRGAWKGGEEQLHRQC